MFQTFIDQIANNPLTVLISGAGGVVIGPKLRSLLASFATNVKADAATVKTQATTDASIVQQQLAAQKEQFDEILSILKNPPKAAA